MINISKRDIRKAEIFLEAEKLEKQAHDRPQEKRDWLTTHCPKCSYRIQYIPTEKWKGRLKCPECGEIFNIPAESEEKLKISRLDEFSKSMEEGDKDKRKHDTRAACKNKQRRALTK